MDCGPTCLRMITKHYGRYFSLQTLREKTHFSKTGVSLNAIADAAESIGFRTLAVNISFDKLSLEVPLPCIVHFSMGHFVVVYDIKVRPSLLAIIRNLVSKKERDTSSQISFVPRGKVYVADPAKGLIQYSIRDFVKMWHLNAGQGDKKGIALLLEPSPSFYANEGEISTTYDLRKIFYYLGRYKKLIVQIILGLFVSSGLQFLFPFLTQAIVDIGISTKNVSFLYIILAGQLMLMASRFSVEFIRSWLLLHLSIRLNLSILSDFLIKLMKLPVSFFDTKKFGDLMQRINDHNRIESFFTSETLSVIFSVFNLLIFSVILGLYNLTVFGIFLTGSLLYVGWIFLFLPARRKLDFLQFQARAKSQGLLIQIIQGMQEIKLAGSERPMRWIWESQQAVLLRQQIKNLSINQFQQGGALLLNEGKNIIIIILCANAVIDGDLTLGGMLAIQYIIGQLNAPVDQLVGFVRDFQGAKISLERMNEIHSLNDEEPHNEQLHFVFPNGNLRLHKLSFKYPGTGSDFILKDISLTIPYGKTTAIVGMSGNGKTTLLKLLLKFYEPSEGEIFLGDHRLSNLSHSAWRSKCGVVMQDGYIFSDSIARNIAVGAENINLEKLTQAIHVANLQEFISNLPSGYHTKIGDEGNGISQGQKQRILIARAVYKNPRYILFDEATNALDANNEAIIMNNLKEFFIGKTVVVVAHRLSTVSNADQILVLERGEITELGTHDSLVESKGAYWTLVKNQLELGA